MTICSMNALHDKNLTTDVQSFHSAEDNKYDENVNTKRPGIKVRGNHLTTN